MMITKGKIYTNGAFYPSIRITIYPPTYWLDRLQLFLKMASTCPQAIQMKEPEWNGYEWTSLDDIHF